ncbi:MAG: transcription elongation factor GreA [Bacteroidia bacterium]|nr:transcription elongation factor GreA [Bacteroidia bacterium]
MANFTLLTKASFERIKNELNELKTVKRAEIAAAIAEAREKGDLSENAEYKAAKDEQGLLEMKINELELKLANGKLIDEDDIDTSKVSLLTKVTIRNKKNNKELTYMIVPESDANLKEKKISISSPVGQGLLNHKVGEIADVTTPAGKIQFEILNITA